MLTAADGGYRFQSDPPEHIHMLVSAEGFEPLASNRYHPEGRPRGRFDILLTPVAVLTAGGWRRPSGNVLPL